MKLAVASFLSCLLAPVGLLLWWLILVAGLQSPLVVLLWAVLLGPPAAIVLGHLARAAVRRPAAEPVANRFALTGLILGYAELVFLVLVVVAVVVLVLTLRNSTF